VRRFIENYLKNLTSDIENIPDLKSTIEIGQIESKCKEKMEAYISKKPV
jgi:hypothetical protein